MSHVVAASEQVEITLDTTCDGYIDIRQGGQIIFLHHLNRDVFIQALRTISHE